MIVIKLAQNVLTQDRITIVNNVLKVTINFRINVYHVISLVKIVYPDLVLIV